MWQCVCGMENADQVMNCEKCHYNRDYVKRVREAEEYRRSAKLTSVEEASHGSPNNNPVSATSEHFIQNAKLNSIKNGFLWGQWYFLPIVGGIILTIKILNRLFDSREHKIIMFISLFILIPGLLSLLLPLLLPQDVERISVIISCLISLIIFDFFIFKRIGRKFLVGTLIPLTLILALIVNVLFSQRLEEQLPYSEFKTYLRQGRIDDVQIDARTIYGTLRFPAAYKSPPLRFMTIRVDDPDLVRELEAHHIKYSGRK